MRGVFVVLMLMVLAVSAGLFASRAHAAPVPKCELLAMTTINNEFASTVGTIDNIECVAERGGAHAFTICEMTASNDKGFLYVVAMPLNCEKVLHFSRVNTKDEGKAAADQEGISAE
jgi:hypothetical protein